MKMPQKENGKGFKGEKRLMATAYPWKMVFVLTFWKIHSSELKGPNKNYLGWQKKVKLWRTEGQHPDKEDDDIPGHRWFKAKLKGTNGSVKVTNIYEKSSQTWPVVW